MLLATGFFVAQTGAPEHAKGMQRSLHAKLGLGAALQIVQEGGHPLRRVLVDFPSLILVLAGRKQIQSSGVTCIAQPGEMLAIGPGSELEVTNTPPAVGPYQAYCLSFDPQFCSAIENPLAQCRVIAPAVALGRPPGYLLSAFEKAAASCTRAAAPPDRILRHQFQEVLLGLELLGWKFDTRAVTRTSARIRRLLAAAPTERWKITAVGKLLGLSEATLRRRLEAEGLGFRQIIAQVRMGRALALLQSSDLSVTEIAYEVGYESISQFSAKFRRHFGQSPGQLRGPGGKL